MFNEVEQYVCSWMLHYKLLNARRWKIGHGLDIIFASLIGQLSINQEDNNVLVQQSPICFIEAAVFAADDADMSFSNRDAGL